MKKNILAFLFVLFLFNQSIYAQVKSKEEFSQIWMGYLNQTRLSDKWGIWMDMHLRTKDHLTDNFSQSVIRAGLTYYFNDNTRLTAGYTYFTTYVTGKHHVITQPEHRPWQQFQWQTKYGKKIFIQRVRLEERYRRIIVNDSALGKGYNFNFRARYSALLQVPLSKKGSVANTVSFIANDEIHINFGKQIVYNYFDQNRIFIGFAYHTTDSDNIQVGYMNIFQQLPAGNRYRSTHVLRIFYLHNLDLRRH